MWMTLIIGYLAATGAADVKSTDMSAQQHRALVSRYGWHLLAYYCCHPSIRRMIEQHKSTCAIGWGLRRGGWVQHPYCARLLPTIPSDGTKHPTEHGESPLLPPTPPPILFVDQIPCWNKCATIALPPLSVRPALCCNTVQQDGPRGAKPQTKPHVNRCATGLAKQEMRWALPQKEGSTHCCARLCRCTGSTTPQVYPSHSVR